MILLYYFMLRIKEALLAASIAFMPSARAEAQQAAPAYPPTSFVEPMVLPQEEQLGLGIKIEDRDRNPEPKKIGKTLSTGQTIFLRHRLTVK